MKRCQDSLTSPKFWDKLQNAPAHEVTAPAQIIDVQMMVLSAADIKRMSVCPVQTTTLYEKSLPRAFGINDVRMGTVDRKLRCGTCLNGMLVCNGHTAHIDLPMSVYHISYISNLVKIFRCICPRCLNLTVKSTDPTFQRIQKKFDKLPKQRFSSICNYLKNKKSCANCKFLLPKYIQQAFVIKREWSAQSKRQFSLSELTLLKKQEEVNLNLKKIFRKLQIKKSVPFVPNGDEYQQPFTPEIAKTLLEVIDASVYKQLGLLPEISHPKNFIIDTLLVPPPVIRPSIMFSESSRTRGQDDLTHKLQEILKASQKLGKSMEDKEDVASNFELLQSLVATYMNNESAGAKMPTKKRSGLPEMCVVKRFKGKHGRFRGNLMGKRVDFSARTVVSPASNADVGEIGVPLKAAIKLTFSEIVTSHNIETLRKRVQLGHGVIDGAKSITKANGQQISLEMCKKPSAIRLQLGWTVERYMQDGDYVLFNRQPSLRKTSIMAHKVRIMPGRTFRLNLSCTGPYNADFDGDEMNLHMLQNTQSVAEAKLLMSVESQLLNAQNNKPCMGIVQDALLGAFLLSNKDEFLTEGEFMQLVTHIHYPKTKFLPTPAILKPTRLYTGKQALSLILPRISLSKTKDKNQEPVVIVDGELLQGCLCKQTIGASSGGIIHVTCKYIDNSAAMNFMSDCQRLVNAWLENQGFSIGLSDCITDKQTTAKVKLAVEACVQHVKSVTRLGKDLKLPLSQREGDASQILSKMLNVTGGIIQEAMKPNNALQAMISAGSKGNPINISQIAGCVGQQSIEGHRVFDDMNPEHRTLACFPPKCDDPESRGFVRSSYVEGLQPEELFFHTMGGREGIVDTSVKSVTADTEIVVCYEQSIFSTTIGSWIDGLLDKHMEDVQYFPKEANMELLQVQGAMIPTVSSRGIVTWGELTAVTRHDPSPFLYHVTTQSGREITVVQSKSVIVWNEDRKEFLPCSMTRVKCGDYLPTTAQYAPPPILSSHLEVQRQSVPELLELNRNLGMLFGFHLSDRENNELLRNAFVGWSAGSLLELMLRCTGEKETTKHIPQISYSAPDDFLIGLLDGYFYECAVITASSASRQLLEGISWICSRLGVFCTVSSNKSLFCLTLCQDETSFLQVENVILDRIVSIVAHRAASGQKVYDVTVPSTFNFGIKNGLQVRDTADTGYLQRRLVKALENISVEYDGSVRDSYGNIIEMSYGSDNCDAAFLEKVNMFFLKFDRKRLEQEFGKYQHEVAPMIEMVNQCLQKKISLLSPQLDVLCHIPVNVKLMLQQPRSKKNNQKKVDPKRVTSEVQTLVQFFKDKQGVQTLYMRATFMYHLRSHNIVDILGLSEEDFTEVLFLIHQQYDMAIVNPGEMVGVIAAQSVGEPCTQLTLNSLDYEERIIVRNTHTQIISTPKIGSFVDELFANNHESKIQYFEENGTENLDTCHLEYEVPDIDEHGTLQFNKLEGVTRHPPPDDAMLVKITTQTGRCLVATPSKSFLLRQDNCIVGVKGSDLKIGDAVPIVGRFPDPKQRMCTFETRILDNDFGFVLGTFLAKGSIYTSDPVCFLRITARSENMEATTCAFLAASCGTKSRRCVPDFAFGANKEFLSGLLDGYVSAAGMVNRLHIRILSAPKRLLDGIALLLSMFGIRTIFQKAHILSFFCVEFRSIFRLTSQSKQKKLERAQSSERCDVIPGCLFQDGTRANVPKTILHAMIGVHPLDDEWIGQCLKDHVHYDPIVKIERVASSKPVVFDLTVAHTRNFISAQGIACRDTFHFAGVAAKNVTLGVPRIKELIDARRINQTPATSVFLLEPFSRNKEFVDTFKETLVETYLSDIVQSFEIILDPDPTTTTVDNEVDRFLVQTYRSFGEPPSGGSSSYVIRMVLKKELLAVKELTVNNIRDLIRSALPGKSMFHMLTSEPNMHEWIVRIRMCHICEMKDYLVSQVQKESKEWKKCNGRFKYSQEQIDQIALEFEKNMSHAFVKYLSRTLFICGIPGVEAVSLQEASTTKWNAETLEQSCLTEYYIHTTGSNLRALWNLTVVDWKRTWCNNIFDILDTLGVEAAAMVLFHEIRTVLSFDGCYVNNRHIMIDYRIHIPNHTRRFFSEHWNNKKRYFCNKNCTSWR